MYKLVLVAVGSAIAMFVAAQLIMSPHRAAVDEANAKADVHALAASARHAASDEKTEIARDESGQFRLTAQVNGQDARFLVDTGADMVALTVEDARNLGIDFDPGDFQVFAPGRHGLVGQNCEQLLAENCQIVEIQRLQWFVCSAETLRHKSG